MVYLQIILCLASLFRNSEISARTPLQASQGRDLSFDGESLRSSHHGIRRRPRFPRRYPNRLPYIARVTHLICPVFPLSFQTMRALSDEVAEGAAWICGEEAVARVMRRQISTA